MGRTGLLVRNASQHRFQRQLEKLQQEAGRHIPVIYIHEEVKPDILQTNYREEANARVTARQQLELGCRRFAGIGNTTLAMKSAVSHIDNTADANGNSEDSAP